MKTYQADGGQLKKKLQRLKKWPRLLSKMQLNRTQLGEKRKTKIWQVEIDFFIQKFATMKSLK